MAERLAQLRFAWVLERASIRAEMQYRTNFFSMVLLGLVYQASGFSFVFVVMHNFDLVGGWNLGEIAFLYGLRLLAHAVCIVPLSHLWMLDREIREAKFDRYLVRPLSPFLQFLTSKFQMNAVGDLIAALAVLGFAATQISFDFTMLTILYLLVSVVGAAMIEASLQVSLASIAFRTLNTEAIRSLADTVMGLLGSYPLTIFSKFTAALLTFPIAFLAYFPAAIALGKQADLAVPVWIAYCTAPIGVLSVLLARKIWGSQVRHYQSSGH
ncbi:ABC-2 family transporter protein [Streptomyces californicus]|uniref:ABC transporter permease n=1 Tax=Streptomyces californicus TaxID=67351 RepID=UPI00296F7A6D|nr:ABC-2 family transporter protein [Streptomyces californicus]MDW4901635.1 ABC-2 family transporter protein [Streptomyces californicus]